jgi:hypothetical protein
MLDKVNLFCMRLTLFCSVYLFVFNSLKTGYKKKAPVV